MYKKTTRTQHNTTVLLWMFLVNWTRKAAQTKLISINKCVLVQHSQVQTEIPYKDINFKRSTSQYRMMVMRTEGRHNGCGWSGKARPARTHKNTVGWTFSVLWQWDFPTLFCFPYSTSPRVRRDGLYTLSILKMSEISWNYYHFHDYYNMVKT